MTMEKIMLGARQTGRTTRMIKQAVELAQAGKAVYIVAFNLVHKAGIERRMESEGIDFERLGIKVEIQYRLPELDWTTMTLPGAHPNCVVLADHATIEGRYRRLLEMLHRYDEV